MLEPDKIIDAQTYETLLAHGFRRSGNMIYRPHCAHCNACIPARIPVIHFRPNRAQRRTWQRNQDLIINEMASQYTSEHYELYKRYQQYRHAGSGMDKHSFEDYKSFLHNSHVPTQFYEFRLSADHRLAAVAVTDILQSSLSAVYSFFDPNFAQRSLGTFAILYEINRAQTLGLKWLYLGYWIKDCPKMAYKGNYRPLQIYQQASWQNIP